ncbi:MAG: ABC transporter ATP-binding protein [Chloroflexota bacterium]
MTQEQKQQRPLSTWRYWWGLIRCHPRIYGSSIVLVILIAGGTAQAMGLTTRAFFDSLTNEAPLDWPPTTWAILLMVVAFIRVSLMLLNSYFYVSWTFKSGTVMQTNVFERILARPGAQSLARSTGETINHLRGDINKVSDFTIWSLFPLGEAVFAISAILIMLSISVQITILTFLPLILVVLIANRAAARVQTYHEANRQATDKVTGLISEMFNAVQAVKVAVAEERMLAHFHELNDRRRQSTLRDRVFNEVLNAVFENTANIGTGLILLLAARSLQNGTFTLGDFALFVFYLGHVTDLTGLAGMFMARFKQAGVALARMDTLLPNTPAEALVQPTPIYLQGDLPDVPYVPKTAQDQLDMLTAANLSYCYPGTANAIANINLTLKRGSFTVITGPIGSGKTTLLRTLLGLLPRDSGEIYWNGTPVDNAAEFFTPPRTAYTAQVPRLFSETLKDNILLGLPDDKVDVAHAIQSAVLENDIAQLQDGLETVVGPRGVKLSGGQRQRCAASRMFIRDAELIVFDDLSSALDVQTEQTLLARLFEREDVTCLAVSHRRPVLRRADHIIVLDDGAVAAEGTFEELVAEGFYAFSS